MAAKSIQEVLLEFVDELPGCEGIVVGNCFGLPLIRAVKPGSNDEITKCVETRLSHAFYLASELSERLPTGSTEAAIAFYDRVTVVYGALSPLVVGVVASTDANVGSILEALPRIKEVLGPAGAMVESSGE